MFSYIEIIGFLVLLYTVYLILTEGSNKKDNDNDNSDVNQEKAEDKSNGTKKDEKPKVKKSAPVQTIEDDPDVMKQGKGYTEQMSSEQPNITPISQQHFEEREELPRMEAPSSKNRGLEQPVSESVSVICPYCDNKVLVPKGGSAECSCCSSRLNDMGNVID